MRAFSKHAVLLAMSACLFMGLGAPSVSARECHEWRLPDGRIVRFCVPILIDHRWFDPNPPDPADPWVLDLVRIGSWLTLPEAGPLPDPWQSDVVLLGNIELLAEALSPERRDMVLGALEAPRKSLAAELPEGLSFARH